MISSVLLPTTMSKSVQLLDLSQCSTDSDVFFVYLTVAELHRVLTIVAWMCSSVVIFY